MVLQNILRLRDRFVARLALLFRPAPLTMSSLKDGQSTPPNDVDGVWWLGVVLLIQAVALGAFWLFHSL